MDTKVIIVPVVTARQSQAALSLGRRAAATSGAMLQLFYFTEKEQPPESIIARLGFTPRDMFNAVLTQICGEESKYQAAILEAAARPEVEMMVLAFDGLEPFIDEHLLESLVEHIPCPVFFTRPDLERLAERPIQQLVVPLDGTPSAAAAIEPAVRLAGENDAQLHVLYIATDRSAPHEPGSLPIGPYLDQPQHDWPFWIREFWDRFIICTKQIAPQVKSHLHVIHGEVVEEIKRFVHKHDCDLLTMAINLRAADTQADRLRKLMSQLHCPLLLVRPKEANSQCASLYHSAA
ncbi:MAG: universal stress protein [Acidobacteriota bacterium]